MLFLTKHITMSWIIDKGRNKHSTVYLWKDIQILNAGRVRPAAAVVLLCGQITFLWYSVNFCSTYSQITFKSRQNSYKHECSEGDIVWYKAHPYSTLMSSYNVLCYFHKFLLSYSSLSSVSDFLYLTTTLCFVHEIEYKRFLLHRLSLTLQHCINDLLWCTVIVFSGSCLSFFVAQRR